MTESVVGGPPWLVLPTYNEAANVQAVVAAALSRLPARARVLIVDDGSPDGTGTIADSLAAADSRIGVIHRECKEGLGPAYIAGFTHALRHGAGMVMEMDSDFSHDPADLPRLLAAVEGGADLAIGSRYVEGGGTGDWGMMRRLISRAGSVYARHVLGLGVRDLTGGFRCFRREVFDLVDLTRIESRGYAFQVEIAYLAIQAGFRVQEVPIVFRDRTLGDSKMTTAIATEAIWRIPRLRHAAGARRSTGSPLPSSVPWGAPDELADARREGRAPTIVARGPAAFRSLRSHRLKGARVQTEELRMVGAICVVSTAWVSTACRATAAAGDDQRHVAVLRVGPAVLGDLRLLAGVDDAGLGDAEQVRHPRVTGRGAEVFARPLRRRRPSSARSWCRASGCRRCRCRCRCAPAGS